MRKIISELIGKSFSVFNSNIIDTQWPEKKKLRLPVVKGI